MLIPFAVNASIGEFVDVYQVDQGRDCGCVCPSCGQGVLARQGDANEWHFAHDDSSHIKPKYIPCDISFYGTLKTYMVEIVCNQPPKKMRVPQYDVTEMRHSFSSAGLTEVVTREKYLDVS